MNHEQDTRRSGVNAAALLALCAVLLLGGCAGPAATSLPAPPKPGRYFASVQALIVSQLTYPAGASARTGHCEVRLQFLRDGKIVAADLEKATGDPVLDDECVAVFHRIAQLPPIPEGMAPDAERFRILVPLNFQAD